MKRCHTCKANNPNYAIYCHMCGRRLHNRYSLKWLLYLGVIIGGIVGIRILVLSISRDNQAKLEGEKLAKSINDYQNLYVEKTNNDKDYFIDTFDYVKYETREIATQALKEILKKNKKKYEQERITAQAKFDKIEANYENKHRKKMFEKSFHATLKDPSFDANSTIEKIIESDSFQFCLLCIPTAKPNESQIFRNLKGHKLKGSEDNPFFNNSWHLKIDENNLQQVNIKSSSNKNGKWVFVLDLTMREGGHNLSVIVQAIYELRNYELRNYSTKLCNFVYTIFNLKENLIKEHWTLVDVITDSVTIINTSTYNKAFKIDYEQQNIKIINKNESPLLVGIKIWRNEHEDWDYKKIELFEEESIWCDVREDGSNPYCIVFVEKL